MTAREQGDDGGEAQDLAGRKTVAVCRDCAGLVVPFSGAVEGIAWAQSHRDSTGHEVRTVAGWPAPAEAYARAFPAEPGEPAAEDRVPPGWVEVDTWIGPYHRRVLDDGSVLAAWPLAPGSRWTWTHCKEAPSGAPRLLHGGPAHYTSPTAAMTAAEAYLSAAGSSPGTTEAEGS